MDQFGHWSVVAGMFGRSRTAIASSRVAVSNLDGDGNIQLELPFATVDDDKLDGALDAVRDRFGGKAVTRAASLGQDLNPSVPILSD